MNQKLLDNDPDYHKITSSELISFKTYLPKIQNSFSIIKKHFIGKIKTLNCQVKCNTNGLFL